MRISSLPEHHHRSNRRVRNSLLGMSPYVMTIWPDFLEILRRISGATNAKIRFAILRPPVTAALGGHAGRAAYH